MKIAKKLKAALLCVSLLGLSVPCLASVIPDSLNNQIFQQAEAVVIRVDRDNVLLQDLGDKDNKFVAQFSNAASFKAGDKVVLNGDKLKKVSNDNVIVSYNDML